MARSREQVRARDAISQVGTYHTTASRDDFGAYQAHARGLPSMLQQLGLGGALAFLISKGGPDGHLAIHLGHWLLGEAGLPWPVPAVLPPPGADEARQLVHRIADANTEVEIYALAAREAQRYAGWLKRWSTALALEHADAD
jgi:hypothetical protein